MAILAYPLCIIYLSVFFFFPEIAAIALCTSAIVLWSYLLLVAKWSRFKDKDFSEKERELLYKYPIYFRYYFLSINLSSFLSVVQLSAIIMAIILLFKQLWLYLIPLAIVYFIFANLRPKLDPLFFLKQQYPKAQGPSSTAEILSGYSEQKKLEEDISLMIAVYDKFWGIDKEERAKIDRAHEK